MELENKIKCVLMDFEINEITLQEAIKRILLLFTVVGRSEQLKAFCQYCETRQIQPKRFKWDEVIKDFESL